MGDSIVTRGGERAGECGPIESGLFGVAGRESTFSSSDAMFGCGCPAWNAGRAWSRDMRGLGWEASPNRAVLLVDGEGLGGGSGGFFFSLIMLSKWLRREETGFCRC